MFKMPVFCSNTICSRRSCITILCCESHNSVIRTALSLFGAFRQTVRFSTVGSRTFPVAAPRIWNALPEETTSAQSLTLFRQHLIRQSYPDLFIILICPSQTV